MGSPALGWARTFAPLGVAIQARRLSLSRRGSPRVALLRTVGRLLVDRPDRGRVSCAIGEGSLVPDVVDPNSQSPRERRTAPRLQVNLPARYNSEATSLLGWVANLSRNGLFLRSDYLDEAGAEVSVSFELPGEPHPVALRGQVVRVNDGALCPGMAIRFTQVPDGVERKLAMFMQNRHRFANQP